MTIYQNVTIGRKEADPGRAPRIGRGVLLSNGATILGDLCIGDFAKVGAGSVVTRDVPAGCTAVGVPARLTNCPEAGAVSRLSDPGRPKLSVPPSFPRIKIPLW